MPVYQYMLVDSKFDNEILEIEQSITDEALKMHPITGEPIKRLISSASLTLKHSSSQEQATLAKENLAKKGFTVFEKNSCDPSKYSRTVGNIGPSEIYTNKLPDE